ncbi:3250_t:CDS:2 [Ambispora leptoticha]|uniref:3250_t:CDS:1 n=1 Tax=Ambispora leptoticha TaxID=144679 RepID=A0A9N8WFE5_9GLOM|nr:3250_t:CDS:2 [Ambispora leptoticha]
MTQLFPRATLKRIIKSHHNKALTKNVDVMIYLDYVLFLQRLAEEANIEANQDLNEKKIEERHVVAALERVLQEFQG